VRRAGIVDASDMARLQEVSRVIRSVGPITFIRRVVRETLDDGVIDMGAAVAFYWLLALFPFLIFLITLAPLLPGSIQSAVIEQLSDWLRQGLPDRSADVVLETIESVLSTPRGGLLSVGLLTTIWAASAGMNATMTALDTCYDIKRRRPIYVQRPIAILLTLLAGSLIMLVILLVPIGSIVESTVMGLLESSILPESWSQAITPGRVLAFNLLRYSLGAIVLLATISLIYQFGVSVRRRWTLITPGAVFAVGAIMLLGWAYRFYIETFGGAGYERTYGALAGVAILLLMFYLIAVVFLIGAEINSEIDFAVLGLRSTDTTDPLPTLHGADADKTERSRFLERVFKWERRD
jgi:membrane protein